MMCSGKGKGKSKKKKKSKRKGSDGTDGFQLMSGELSQSLLHFQRSDRRANACMHILMSAQCSCLRLCGGQTNSSLIDMPFASVLGTAGTLPNVCMAK